MVKPISVEQRISAEFNAHPSDLLQSFSEQGMTSKQVAKILKCGVSNARRIARKYNIRFNISEEQNKFKNFAQSPGFVEKKMNALNFLSRPWCKINTKKSDTLLAYMA